MLPMILELIHVARSSYGLTNSAIYQKLLSGQRYALRPQTKSTSASILGTLQATLTDFRYLRKVWQNNTEEEALLGVSLTGIMDHPTLSGRRDKGVLKTWLTELKEEAVKTNAVWAGRLGINVSTAITAVKPSGTVSSVG